MTDTQKTEKKGRHRLARFVAVLCASLCLIVLGAYLLATIYLRTSSAAHKTSQFLTEYLHYPVSVAGLALTGRTLSINGLTIGNPAAFKGGELASARSIAISPDLSAFLHGRRSFDGIAIRGLRVTVGRNEKGDWNFNELARLLSGKKGGGETTIKRLTISQSGVTVEGFRLDNLALNLNDLSTKGTTGSRFLLTCKDAGGNPIRLEGNARLGAVPAVEVVLAAPSFSLQTISRTFGSKASPDLGDGRGSFSLTLKLHDGNLTAEGKLGIDHLLLGGKNGRVPVKGELGFAGRYDTGSDEASLNACSFRLDGIVKGEASGKVRQVKTGRSFEAAVSIDPIDLKTLFAMLPPELRRDLAAGGVLSASAFRISGDAQSGITAGSGALSLRGGEVARGGRLFVKDLAADLTLVRVQEGWQLRGKLAQGGKGAGGVLQALEAPFTAFLSSRLKPLRAEAPSFAARVSGLPLTGRIGYLPGGPAPVTFRLEARKAPLAALNKFLAGQKITFSSGTTTFSVQGTGGGMREFRGKMTAQFAGLRGSAVGKKFAVGDGATAAEFSGSGGKVSAMGNIRLSGGLVDDKKVDFACTYGVRDGQFYLADGLLKLDRSELRFARVRGPLPVPMHAGGITRLPLRLELSSMTARSGDAALDGLAGNLAVDYRSGQGGRRLDGSGTVTVRKLLYKGGEIGALEAGLSFTGNDATARLRGTLLGGRLTGTVNLGPFDLNRKTGFSMNLDGARCAALAAFEPAGFPVKVTSGLLGVKLAGSNDRKDGLRCRLEGEGREITLTGRGGKTVLEDGGMRTVCDVAGGTLFIREGVVTAGSAIALKGKGTVARPLSPDREGDVSISLAATPLDTLFTVFVNLLPSGLQEASAAGTVAADGRVHLAHMQTLLDGVVSLHKAGLEITSQKFSVDDMTGTIPFSLAITGAAAAGRPEKRKYSRDNYPALIADLRRTAKTGQTFSVGGVRFGGIEFGKTSLAIRAGNGLMEITSLESALFDGTLLGEGFFRYGSKMQYGADLTVNNLSLRALCNANPGIKGYISGRVDGIVSLYGEGQGLNGLSGFTEIWTRSAPGEKMQVSKEFLQKLAGKKFKGLFFRNDRPYDRGEIRGYLENGYLTFDTLDISHTNVFGIKDLSVAVAPVQNRIALGHLYTSIREAATRGKAVGGGEAPPSPPAETEFKWEE
jgi:Domain of Unknown Function (DUF748)